MKLLKSHVIYGCEGNGDGEKPYLTRTILFKSRWCSLFLHRFHRSDVDTIHDHPWCFMSLILRQGYIDETPHGRRRKRPGMLLFRPARWAHRVELETEEA